MKRLFLTIVMSAALVTSFVACSKNNNEITDSITDTDIAKDNNIIVTREEKEEMPIEQVEDKGILYRELQDENVASGITKMNASIKDDCMLMPILQNPTEDGVYVQWFTETEGSDNYVLLYEDNMDNPSRQIAADTYKMSRLRGGKKESNCNDPKIKTEIYKHVAYVDGLEEYNGYVSQRVNYKITSDGEQSQMYSLSAKPKEGCEVKILLTSDFQIKEMCAANIQKVYEQVGHVDAIFVDGDIVDVSDRVYDWFYADNAFWRVLTGTANHKIKGNIYYGAPLAQEVPIYTAIGNHDVMGVYDEKTDLSVQFNNPLPRNIANDMFDSLSSYESAEEKEEHREEYVRDHSYNTITYEEMFELPKNNDDDTEKYYSLNFGDVALVSLDVSRVWRLPNLGIMGKFSELPGATPNVMGYGDFIFEPVCKGSKQINFLEKALANKSYVNSKYKMIMFHNDAHSLGGNASPAFTDPVASSVTDNVTGLNMITYNYPIKDDYINNVIEPLAEKAGTHLILDAHSHLWNRFVTDSGMNVLETSNVGNSYGAYYDDDKRTAVPSCLISGDEREALKSSYSEKDYPVVGDLFGLTPKAPSICDVSNGKPYIASNDLTVFSVLDTKAGTVDSFCFDTTDVNSSVVLFDSFDIINR